MTFPMTQKQSYQILTLETKQTFTSELTLVTTLSVDQQPTFCFKSCPSRPWCCEEVQDIKEEYYSGVEEKIPRPHPRGAEKGLLASTRGTPARYIKRTSTSAYTNERNFSHKPINKATDIPS